MHHRGQHQRGDVQGEAVFVVLLLFVSCVYVHICAVVGGWVGIWVWVGCDQPQRGNAQGEALFVVLFVSCM